MCKKCNDKSSGIDSLILKDKLTIHRNYIKKMDKEYKDDRRQNKNA
jgi:hypothetical protein